MQWHRCPRSDESTVGCAVLQLSENDNDSPSHFSLRSVNELAGSLTRTEKGSSQGDRRTDTKRGPQEEAHGEREKERKRWRAKFGDNYFRVSKHVRYGTDTPDWTIRRVTVLQY